MTPTEPLFAEHRRIGLDSNVLIYLLEGSTAYADAAGALLDAVAAGEGEAVLASLAVAEIATGPARAGDVAMVQRYADELSSLEGVRVVQLDVAVAVEAALIRGSMPVSIADAVHLASARLSGATAFVTNDRRISTLPGLSVVYLDDLAGTSSTAL